MPVVLRLLALTAALAMTLTTSVVAQEAAPTGEKRLTVELASGRKFTGAVDAKTNDAHLVLRFTRGTASLKRPIEWNRVVKASVDGQAVEMDKLRETAEGMKSEGPAVRSQESGVSSQESGIEVVANRRAEPAPPARVTSVTFDARLANWDGDAETDGLIVELMPLSDEGFLLPADGTVEVELFAPQHRVFHHAPLSGGDTLERVERWTRAVNVDDFGASGARLRLPFGAIHPEFDLDWTAVGLVHVRLVVPGDGVFEDSRDGLRIRPFAPNRDRYEMNTGRRFVPTETVGRHD